MSNTLLRKLAIVVLALMALVAPTFAQDDTGVVVVEPGGEIVVGLASILSGENAILGADIVRGVELAQEDRPNVVVDGNEFPVTLDQQDDLCSAEGGTSIANYYVSNPQVVGVVGPTCSSACVAAGPIFDEAGYSNISSSCTAPALTSETEGFASFNRTTPNDALQGAAAADFIFNELGITSVATIHDGSPYGEGLVNQMTETFTELGGEVVYADALNVGDTDFRSLLDSVAAAQPQLIYFGGFAPQAALLLEQRADVGLEEVPLMGADGVNTPETITQAGDAAEGTYVSSPVPPAGDAVTEFVARYTETYGTEPTAAFNTYAYDAYNVLLDSIEAVAVVDENGGLSIDRAALAEALRSYGAEEPINGLSGTLSCEGTGDCARGIIGFFQATEGEFQPLEFTVDTSAFGMEEGDMMEGEATEEAMMEEEAAEGEEVEEPVATEEAEG